MGKLLVSEWGERRIVRIEEDGSRTPMAITVPSPCMSGDKERLNTPNHLLYTPWGNLIFVDSLSCDATDDGKATTSGAVYRIQEAVNVPALPVSLSREAHSWNDTSSGETETKEPELLYNGMDAVYGVTLSHDLTSLFVSGVVRGNGEDVRALIVKLPLDDDDDDDDDDEEKEEEEESSDDADKKITMEDSITENTADASSSSPMGILDSKSK
eukprot:10253494-Ditylum_brightwellii.AAC.1